MLSTHFWHVTSSGVYDWKNTPDHSMVTHIWLAQKCLKDIFLITKRLQEKGIYLYKEATKTEAIIPQECVVYYGIDIQPTM